MDDAEIQDIAKLLWEAPFGVLSLDLEEDPETPKYVVALNQTYSCPSLPIIAHHGPSLVQLIPIPGCLHACSFMAHFHDCPVAPGSPQTPTASSTPFPLHILADCVRPLSAPETDLSVAWHQLCSGTIAPQHH